MGVFDDKKFDNLDWMTQITETIDADVNVILTKLPDKIEMDLTMLQQHATGSRFIIRADHIISNLIADMPEMISISWKERDALIECFKFEMSSDFELDLEIPKLTGSISLVKVAPTLLDEQLQPIMGFKGIQGLDTLVIDSSNWSVDRMNEMLDILGKCEAAKKNRSYNKKINCIKERLHTIFTTNEWRIRDMTLANKISKWVGDYIESGNLASLTNLCKLKVMTHNSMPIYSIEEEK